MADSKVNFVTEVASEVPWYRFECEDCGAFRDQRLRKNRTIEELNKAHIKCAGCHGEAFITNSDEPVLGECLVDWWTDDEGNEVGERAPRDFMNPTVSVKVGWLRKLMAKVKAGLAFLAGEG